MLRAKVLIRRAVGAMEGPAMALRPAAMAKLIHSLLFIHLYVHGGICMGLWMCALVWWAEIDVRCLSYVHHQVFLLRRCYSLSLKSISLTRLVSHWASGICLACWPSVQGWSTSLCLTFHVGSGDSNSGLRAFIVGTLSTEPSLQPPIILFCFCFLKGKRSLPKSSRNCF